jgi:hypothetical protein
MVRTFLKLVIVGSLLLALKISPAPAQEPDGTVKITRRSVAQAVGLSWGDGVLTYKGKDYVFSFKASGLLRDVEENVTAAELSGQVFNLKNLEDFNGNYKTVEPAEPVGNGAAQATIKNQNGVVVNVIATTGGRKFTLGPDGMTIQLKK